MNPKTGNVAESSEWTLKDIVTGAVLPVRWDDAEDTWVEEEQYAPDMEPNMHLYQILDGEIEMVDNAAPETNGTESILALADSPASAVWAATLYDRGELQPDNHVWNGETIVALRYDGEHESLESE